MNKRETLRQLYAQLKPVQQELFCRLYVSVDEIKKEKMPHAILQCRNTIEINELCEEVEDPII